MLTRNQIKYIQDFSKKSHRAEHKKFVVEGEKLVNELLQSQVRVDAIYALDEFECLFSGNLTRISGKDLSRISQLKSPNKVVAVAHWPSADWEIGQLAGSTLFLDRINDPGNLGTIIRLADWFGISDVICTEQSVDVYNPKVIQSSMGSVFRVKVRYVNGPAFLDEYRQEFENAQIVTAEMSGKPLSEFSFSDQVLLIMGSESHGVQPELKNHVNGQITIPRIGGAESLNVATATGMILWEMFR